MWVATQERDGVLFRRCAHADHVGARWLPLDADNFYLMKGRFGYWCKACQRTHARESWRAKHPKAQRRRVGRKSSSCRDLAAATASWGR